MLVLEGIQLIRNRGSQKPIYNQRSTVNRPRPTDNRQRSTVIGHRQYGEGLTEVHPPSTTRLWPVIFLALSDTRKIAASAMSLTDAGLPSGVSFDQVLS